VMHTTLLRDDTAIVPDLFQIETLINDALVLAA
jgi:hypothetical protein